MGGGQGMKGNMGGNMGGNMMNNKGGKWGKNGFERFGAYDQKGNLKGSFSGKGGNVDAQMYVGYVHEINPDRHHGFLRSRTIMSIWPGKDAYVGD